MVINELDINVRFKFCNTIIAGFWIGKKPNYDEYLKPIIKELKLLELGQLVTLNQTNSLIRFFVCHGVFDKPCRAAILNMIQYNGLFGCLKCYQPGLSLASKNSGTIHVYKFIEDNPTGPKRTHSTYHDDLVQVIKTNKVCRGVKGDSPLNQLKYYFPIEGTVIDYMHSVLEGVVKRLLQYWFFTIIL